MRNGARKYAPSFRNPKSRSQLSTDGDESSRGHTDYVNMAAWSQKRTNAGQLVLTCSDDKTAVIWEADGERCGQRRCTMHDANAGHLGPVVMASWNYQEAWHAVLTCSYDKTCILWDATNGCVKATYPHAHTKDGHKDGHTEAVWSAYFSPDDKSVLTASKDKTAKVWDTNKSSLKQTFRGHEEVVLQAVWNPQDANQLMTCSLDNTVKLWDVRQEEPTTTLREHKSCVWSVAFGNKGDDKRAILTASHDMTALVYDQRLKLVKNTLAGHTGILWQASFSAEDTWVVTCSEDTTARVWNLQTGARRPPCHILRLGQNGHTQAVTCAAFRE